MKKILKYIIPSIVVLLVIFTYIGTISYKKYKNKKDPNKILASSNLGDVTNKDVKDYLDNVSKLIAQKIDISDLTPKELKVIVNEVVNQRKVLQDAKKSKIASSDGFRTRLNALRDDLLKEMYLKDLIEENIKEDDIIKEYKKQKGSSIGKKEYKVKHILVKTESEINKIRQEAKKSNFENLAKKYSIDPSGKQGGDLGYVAEGQTVPEFEQQCKNLKNGEISKPFKSEFGWHIILKEDERKMHMAKFKEMKQVIYTSLVNNYIRKYSDNNIKEANIKYSFEE